MKRLLLRYVLLIACCMIFTVPAYARLASIEFNNTTKLGSANYIPVFCIEQDDKGYIWLGSNDGLFRYNGYQYKNYKWEINNSHSLPHDRVNDLYYDGSSGLYIATDAGAAIYDFSTDQITRIPECEYRQIKSITQCGESLWFATTSGIISLGKKNREKREYINNDTSFSPYIASCTCIDGKLFFGGYNYIFSLDNDKNILAIKIPYSNKFSNNLVLDIVQDIECESALWIATERGLIHYDMQNKKSKLFLDGTPVKKLKFTYDNNLWIATDNGLYIKEFATDTLHHYRHKSNNPSSLSNDVVWDIFEDHNGSIWLATDAGFSLASIHQNYKFQTINSLTGINNGFNTTSIISDQNGSIWLGGNNGLIYYNIATNRSKWFTKENSPLPHNKIKELYFDDNYLWIATDGGLCRFKDDDFEVFNMGNDSSNWVYSVSADSQNRLWIASYNGVYLTSKENPTFDNKITPYITTKIVVVGDTTYLLTTAGLYSVDNNLILDFIKVPAELSINTINSDGTTLYISTTTGVYYLNADNNPIALDGYNVGVGSIVRQKDYLWGNAENKIIGYNIENQKWERELHLDRATLCSYVKADTLLIGSIDGIYTIPATDIPYITQETKTAAITDLIIDDKSIGVKDKITLPYNNNSLKIEFSAFNYNISPAMYAHRIKGYIDTWQTNDVGINTATLYNLPAGEYMFEVATINHNGDISKSPTILPIVITPAWYSSSWAFAAYVLIAFATLGLIFHYLWMKHRYQLEHIEREKTMEMIERKNIFFANLSHEFKTPLSIVLGHLSRMISTESNAIRTKELEAARGSAEKMHLLINRMLESNNNNAIELFIPTATAIDELLQQIFDRFQIAFEQKNIDARLHTTKIDYVFMLDRVKIESAIENLISNAIKFTPQGGTIVISLDIAEQTSDILTVEIKVKDSGCGVTAEELPLIFNQYYKAPSNQMYNTNGSGIGLNLVRQIVEQHKGSITATSAIGEGSEFTIKLSTLKVNSFIINTEQEEELTLHNLSQVWGHERKPIILIVDDNSDILDFIIASLSDDFIFLTANDGKEAIKLVESEKIDLIITDYAMPNMSGLEFSRIVRANVKSAFIPIILLTATKNNTMELEAMESVDMYITKPFNLNFLTNAMIRLLIKHEHHLRKIKEQQIISPKVDVVENPDEKFLTIITDLVNERISDFDFTASQLCELSPYGSKQVYRKIKTLTGMSIVEFIRDMRLQKAALLLSQRGITTSEVMYMVGFSSSSYFAKCFKAKYGVSPSSYNSEAK